MFSFSLIILCIALASAQNGSFKVFHSIVGGPAVDVCAGGSALVSNLAYLSESYYVSVAPNTYTISVYSTSATNPCTGTAIITQSVTIAASTFYSVVAHGDGNTNAYALLALVDTNTIPGGSNFNVRFVHASAGNPAVDILAGANVLFSNVAYGQSASTSGIPSSVITISAVVHNTATVVAGPVNITFLANTVYTIFASGQPFTGSNPLAATLAIDATSQTANLKVVHAVAELNAPAVDVYINGAEVIPNFAYKSVVGYVDVPVQQLTVDIYLHNTKTKVLTPTTFTPAPNAYYTAVAQGDALPIGLLLLTDDNTAPAAGDVKVRFAHVSAGSPNVDIVVDGTVAWANVAYGSTGTPVYASLPAKEYNIEVKVAGSSTVVVGPYKLRTSNPQVITVYAAGIAGAEGVTKLDAIPCEDAPDSRTLTFSAGVSFTPSATIMIMVVLSITALMF